MTFQAREGAASSECPVFQRKLPWRRSTLVVAGPAGDTALKDRPAADWVRLAEYLDGQRLEHPRAGTGA